MTTLRSHFIAEYSSPECRTLCGRVGTRVPDKRDSYVTATGREFLAYPVGLDDVEVTCTVCRQHQAVR